MSRKKSNINEKSLKEIGSRIRSVRKRFKLNQAEFSKSIGISSNYLSNLETGKYEPSMPILLAIKNRYSIEPESILNDTKPSYLEKNVTDLQVASPEPEYKPHGDWQPSQAMLSSEEWNLIGKAHEIIKSKTAYSSALISSINAFYQAMKDDDKKGLNGEQKGDNTEKKAM